MNNLQTIYTIRRGVRIISIRNWEIKYFKINLILFIMILDVSMLLLCAHSSFTIILKRKRKLVVFLLLAYRCIVTSSVALPRGAEGWSAVCDCGVS